MRSDKISCLLSCIHSSDFSGIFATADVEELRQTMTSFSGVSYYDLLNVPNDAHAVTAATEKHRSLILRFHPDKTVGKSDQAARTEIFKLIQNVYETLSDPEKKQRYDDARMQNARTRTTGSNPSKQNDENEFYAVMTRLKNNKVAREGILNNSGIILCHAREGRWIFVRCILIMFRDMLDRDFPNCMREFPAAGSNDNPFYAPGHEPMPTAALTEFSSRFRDPIIFLLKESIRHPDISFYLAFSVLKANPLWMASEMLLDPTNRGILNFAIERLEDELFRREFQSIFNNARSIESLLSILSEAQRKIVCHECISHIRYIFCNNPAYFQQMNLSVFSPLLIYNFSLVLAYKAVRDYETEKQTTACCCNSFFFSWKSSGSKSIFYALQEITNTYRRHIDYENPTHIIWIPSPEETNRDIYKLIYKALFDHGSEVGTHLCSILRKYQLIDEDKKPSRKLFAEMLLPENADRMRFVVNVK